MEQWMEMGAIHRDRYLLLTLQTWLPVQPDPFQPHRVALQQTFTLPLLGFRPLGPQGVSPTRTMGRLNTRAPMCAPMHARVCVSCVQDRRYYHMT